MFCANPQCPEFVELGVHGEYQEEITRCPVCGADLVAELPEDEIRRAVDPEEPLETVASYNFRQDAELAASLLNAEGIEATILADDAAGVYPAAGFLTFRVVVPAGQLAEARELLETPGEETPEAP